jgi:hypothetical protein
VPERAGRTEQDLAVTDIPAALAPRLEVAAMTLPVRRAVTG